MIYREPRRSSLTVVSASSRRRMKSSCTAVLLRRATRATMLWPWKTRRDRTRLILTSLYKVRQTVPGLCVNIVEPILKDHPIGHKNVVCQDRWSLVTGSVMLKCRSFCQKCMVFQDRWSLAVVSWDRFHCIQIQWIYYMYIRLYLRRKLSNQQSSTMDHLILRLTVLKHPSILRPAIILRPDIYLKKKCGLQFNTTFFW